MLPDTPMTTIALYDYPSGSANLQAFWRIMMDFSEKTDIPWGSLGVGDRLKYLTFKGGASRVIKNDLSGLQAQERLSLLGGVSEAGTSSDWQVSAGLTKDNKFYDQYTTYLSFPSSLLKNSSLKFQELLCSLLTCVPSSYGIVFDMIYAYAPDTDACGFVVHTNMSGYWRSRLHDDLTDKWAKVYRRANGTYRTGLLRDVYPHNILVDTHLNERVGHTTLGAWIQKEPARGTLEKITDTHYLWSIDSADIPPIQEALQDAGLLLCYKL